MTEQEGGFHRREIQNLAEISKEESSMIIVYPQKSSVGAEIAHAAVALASRAANKKKKAIPVAPVKT